MESKTGITEEQAKALYDSGWWKGLDARDIVKFQLFEPRLCMPFGDFQAAVEAALGRPVWTHEFGNSESLQRQFLGTEPAPSMEDIINMIPADKRILVAV